MPEKNKNFLMFFLYSHIVVGNILCGHSEKDLFYLWKIFKHCFSFCRESVFIPPSSLKVIC